VLVFIACDPDHLRALADGERLSDLAAWTAAGSPTDSGTLEPDLLEQQEHEALVRASAEGLARYGLRLVIVADQAATGWTEPPNAAGRGRWRQLEPRRVTAFFADDPADLELVQQAGQSLAGTDPAQAWRQPAAAPLLDRPLMWYDVTELGRPLSLATVSGIVELQPV